MLINNTLEAKYVPKFKKFNILLIFFIGIKVYFVE